MANRRELAEKTEQVARKLLDLLDRASKQKGWNAFEAEPLKKARVLISQSTQKVADAIGEVTA